MNEVEAYLAGITILAILLYVVILARRAMHLHDADQGVTSRSLWVTDATIIVLAISAASRNAFHLEGATAFLGIAWTVICAAAIARLLGPARTRSKFTHIDPIHPANDKEVER